MDFRLKECLDALGEKARVLEKNDDEAIVKQLIDTFPPAAWGRIDWREISKKHFMNSENEIITTLKNFNKKTSEKVYIIWHDGSLPVLESTLDAVLKNLYDVTTTSCDTWIYCPSDGWVIEFNHDGQIILGFV